MLQGVHRSTMKYEQFLSEREESSSEEAGPTGLIYDITDSLIANPV